MHENILLELTPPAPPPGVLTYFCTFILQCGLGALLLGIFSAYATNSFSNSLLEAAPTSSVAGAAATSFYSPTTAATAATRKGQISKNDTERLELTRRSQDDDADRGDYGYRVYISFHR